MSWGDLQNIRPSHQRHVHGARRSLSPQSAPRSTPAAACGGWRRHVRPRCQTPEKVNHSTSRRRTAARRPVDAARRLASVKVQPLPTALRERELKRQLATTVREKARKGERKSQVSLDEYESVSRAHTRLPAPVIKHSG